MLRETKGHNHFLALVRVTLAAGSQAAGAVLGQEGSRWRSGGAHIGTWFIGGLGEPDGPGGPGGPGRSLNPRGEERMRQVVTQQSFRGMGPSQVGESLVPSQSASVADLKSRVVLASHPLLLP